MPSVRMKQRWLHPVLSAPVVVRLQTVLHTSVAEIPAAGTPVAVGLGPVGVPAPAEVPELAEAPERAGVLEQAVVRSAGCQCTCSMVLE